MPSGLKWYGRQAQTNIESETGRRLDACRMLVAGHAKRLVSIAGTAMTGKGKRAKRIYGANPSKPGEPPHKQTGRLRASITSERVGLEARIGTNLKTGRWLELGTKRMAARPWLRRALNEMTRQIQGILRKPMK